MTAERTAELFKAIGEENRLRILSLLASRGEICVCDLAKVLGVPQARISRHLTALRHAGLVTQRREGAWIIYALAEPVGEIHTRLVACMRECFPSVKALATDLRTFDRLRRGRALMCCEYGEER